MYLGSLKSIVLNLGISGMHFHGLSYSMNKLLTSFYRELADHRSLHTGLPCRDARGLCPGLPKVWTDERWLQP